MDNKVDDLTKLIGQNKNILAEIEQKALLSYVIETHGISGQGYPLSLVSEVREKVPGQEILKNWKPHVSRPLIQVDVPLLGFPVFQPEIWDFKTLVQTNEDLLEASGLLTTWINPSLLDPYLDVLFHNLSSVQESLKEVLLAFDPRQRKEELLALIQDLNQKYLELDGKIRNVNPSSVSGLTFPEVSRAGLHIDPKAKTVSAHNSSKQTLLGSIACWTLKTTWQIKILDPGQDLGLYVKPARDYSVGIDLSEVVQGGLARDQVFTVTLNKIKNLLVIQGSNMRKLRVSLSPEMQGWKPLFILKNSSFQYK